MLLGGWVDFGMENTPTRKLAAIMFTDIAGFTKSMSYDEQLAIQAVRKKRTIIQPLINEYNGIFVKEIGDGTLSYFNSAIDASNCAISIQEKTYDVENLNIRVGIHIGDIVFDKDDVFGETLVLDPETGYRFLTTTETYVIRDHIGDLILKLIRLPVYL